MRVRRLHSAVLAGSVCARFGVALCDSVGYPYLREFHEPQRSKVPPIAGIIAYDQTRSGTMADSLILQGRNANRAAVLGGADAQLENRWLIIDITARAIYRSGCFLFRI